MYKSLASTCSHFKSIPSQNTGSSQKREGKAKGERERVCVCVCVHVCVCVLRTCGTRAFLSLHCPKLKGSIPRGRCNVLCICKPRSRPPCCRDMESKAHLKHTDTQTHRHKQTDTDADTNADTQTHTQTYTHTDRPIHSSPTTLSPRNHRPGETSTDMTFPSWPLRTLSGAQPGAVHTLAVSSYDDVTRKSPDWW